MQPDRAQADTLIRAAQNGSRVDFARLIETHYDLIFRFAYKYAGNRADAEDITQQACIKVGRFIRQFRCESTFSTWLYRLVINCAKDWARGRGVTAYAEDESAIEPASHQSPAAETQIQLRQVLKQINEMGEGFREAVVLVLGEGLTHKQAAEVLEVKESTISWRIHEVRKRLGQEAEQ